MKSAIGKIASLILFSAPIFAATSIDKSNEQLAKIKAQIEAQTKALDAKLAEKSTLDDQFKRAELKVSQLVIALKQTQNKLDSVQTKTQKLKTEQNKLLMKKAQQQSVVFNLLSAGII